MKLTTKKETLQAAYNAYSMLALKLKAVNELQAANAYAKSALKCLQLIKELNEQEGGATVLPLFTLDTKGVA